MRDERAVSEIVGFVIVFGIIIGSVGILYVVGFQSMNDYQEGEQLRNAERGFDALADNFNDIQRNDGILTRASEINLREGTVSVDENSTVLNVSVDGTEVWNDSLGALRYEKGGTTIAYEGSGVFRGDAGGNIDVKDPILRCGDDVAIVSLVKIEGTPPTIQRTDGIEIEAANEGTEVMTFDGGNHDIEIEVVDSPYGNGWENVLERNGFGYGGPDCTNRDRATIRITTIEIDY